jgi:V/A-type H+-transporting ATPase subunit I
MIVQMRKYAFMVYHREYEAFLSLLRDVGTVHVRETKALSDCPELQELTAERKRVNAAMHVLEKLNGKDRDITLAPAHTVIKEEGLQLVGRIEAAQEKAAQLQIEQATVRRDIAGMEAWGDFSYADLERLKAAGYVITFFTCPVSRFEPAWTEKYNAFVINSVQSITYFITVTRAGDPLEIDAERLKMPDREPAKLRAWKTQLEADVEALHRQLKELAVAEYHTLAQADSLLQNEFNRIHVRAQTEREAGDRLMLLEGWTTVDQAARLEEALEEHGYFYSLLAIRADDKVPIQLKNGSYSRLFEPITRMFSLPNYGEFDQTSMVAPFFMLFFGLCFGDGGYGLLILLACMALRRKTGMKAYRPFLTLFQWLGGMTVLIGALTGSFFGISLVDVPAFKAVKNYFISSDNLMAISLVVGMIHILVGKIVAACKIRMQKGFKYSIAPFAWVLVIVLLAVMLGLPTLHVRLPQTAEFAGYGVMTAGLLVALFYNSPGKNIFLNFGSGLWNTYNVVSGLLGDTLSYIRLFAIGLTGAVLGSVFNSLAFAMTEGLSLGLRIVLMLLILLIGHGINFALCMIGSLVHPVRLIFVEYFKNSEFEGGGIAYMPYRKI